MNKIRSLQLLQKIHKCIVERLETLKISYITQ